MSEVPKFNPVHARVYADSFVRFDLLGSHDELLDALHSRLAAGLSAVTTMQMILGCDAQDASEVMMWVAYDPHDPVEPDPIKQLATEVKHLRDFEWALYSRMTMEGFAWT